MNRKSVVSVLVVALVALTVVMGLARAQDVVKRPTADPCAAGALYDPACDVDHDGDVDIFDIQLAAGHWGQAGPWSSGSWDLTGNAGTTPGTHFLGTSDSQALELKVNNQRALRLEPQAISPNLVGGHSSNTVTPGVYGATIGGGGSAAGPNTVGGTHGTVGGGYANGAGGPYATIGGGYVNSAPLAWTTVGGGAINTASGLYATVGGGYGNAAQGEYSIIGGGQNNLASSGFASVSGGNQNTASGGMAHVGGGEQNTASGGWAVTGGGSGNSASGLAAGVLGGSTNTASGSFASVGGGFGNTTSAAYTTIAGGGRSNPADAATGNRVTDDYGSVGGGGNNRAGDASGATDDRPYATVAGGYGNVASGSYATVAGGYGNGAAATQATVGGGVHNSATGAQSFVGGGEGNTASGMGAAVGGGAFNTATGTNAVVPGGAYNQAVGLYSFAAGQRAKALGSGMFVWADSQPYDWAIMQNNGFWVRATATVDFVVAVDGTGSPTVQCVLQQSSNGWECWDTLPRPANQETVDGVDMVQRLSQVPVTTWSVTEDSRPVRHIGPLPQDVYAAFGIGADEHASSALDMNGLALASIQGLYRLVQDQQMQLVAQQKRIEALETNLAAYRMTPAQAAENVALREEIAGLAARLAALEQQVKQNPH